MGNQQNKKGFSGGIFKTECTGNIAGNLYTAWRCCLQNIKSVELTMLQYILQIPFYG
jgi:hypothetical protein